MPEGGRVLEQLALELARGEIGCLVGSSGCGKTTLLRAVAGFLPVARGTIEIDGVVVSGPHFTAPPEKRGVGLVFQDYALFPHLRVTDNVEFGLRGWAAVRAPGPRSGNARTRRTSRRRRSAIRTSFRAVSSSGWRWRVPWHPAPRCC